MKAVRLTAIAATVAALVGVFAMPASADSVAQPTARGPEATVTLQWLSHQQYTKRFGLNPETQPRKALPAGVKIKTIGPSNVHPNAVDYTIRFTGFDNAGRDLPTRTGILFDERANEWGYLHYSGPHNLFSAKPILAAYNNNDPDFVDGQHLEYVSVLTDSAGNVFVTIRAVTWQGTVTKDKAWRTPDGRPLGTITAFCQGVTLCPDIVNQ